MNEGDSLNNSKTFLDSLLKEKDTVVLAISGGPDSMYLANLLLVYKDKLNLKIIIAHVNHSLRKQSEEEEIFVKKYAEENKLLFEYLRIDNYNKENFHNYARTKRYKFFYEIVKKYQANYLMTAHHGDDLIETILMRLTRGSSLKGYSGIKLITEGENFKIVRPLLFLDKKQIIDYMDQNKLKYYIDSSNQSSKYTRNRYRQNILPFLKKEDKNVHLKYLEFSQELESADKYIERVVLKEVKKVYKDNKIDVEKIKKLDDYILKKVIEEILHLVYNNELAKVNKKHQEALYNLINTDKPNSFINLPINIIALKEYNNISFKKTKDLEKENFNYIFNEELILPNKDRIIKLAKPDKTDNFYLYLDSKEITLPLIVRSIQAQDKMAVKNLKGHKKIKDILIDSKIPISIRKQIPVVTDSQNNILWLPGIKKLKFDKAKEQNYDIILKYEKKEGD